MEQVLRSYLYMFKLVEGSDRFDKKHEEPINPSYTIIDNRLESLEFISTNVPLT